MTPRFRATGLPAPGDVPDATKDVGVAALNTELAATSLRPERRDRKLPSAGRP